MHRFAPTLALLAALALAGCFHQETKADLVKKAEGAATAEALRTALGEPDELNKAGPIEEWICDAADGTLRFPIVAGKVGPMITGPKREGK